MAQRQTSAVGHVILLLSGRRKISPGSPSRFYAALAIRQETPTDGTRLLRRDCIGRRADGGFRYIPLSNIGLISRHRGTAHPTPSQKLRPLVSSSNAITPAGVLLATPLKFYLATAITPIYPHNYPR
ncbi:hypothetical protein PCASD_16060 [Puccinia coronata f. sp. avenae]|uniref:Uncharacterized protein n=1 Tax=Puccinia coronata f. sp. avenae TaxID=200324 RepID=A0A2N5U027_9BASI|nr:hypothetical protein PCASD_16060 [Puccinia coronata f. sp. avenae]